MAVFVLDKSGKPLMPCSEKRARLLLERGRARVHRAQPFAIRLVDRTVEESEMQPLCLKIDPGSKATGMALVRTEGTATHTVMALFELQHRGLQIHLALLSRRSLRRRRRRKLRYRPARFSNRSRPQGWLPPSLRHRIVSTLSQVHRIRCLTPVTAIAVERVRFDTQLLAKPETSSVDYQQGELKGYEVREYVLEKWGRCCMYCDLRNVPLQVEHVLARSRGGSNRVSNLGLACQPCNQSKGSSPVAEFVTDQARLKYIISKLETPLRDAAAMNATRHMLHNALAATGLDIEASTGGRTKWNRNRLSIPKSHALDAACVGKVAEVRDWRQPTLVIKAMGRGSYKRTRLNKFGFPRGHLARKKHYFGFSTGDMILADVPTGKYAGVHVGRVAVRATGKFNITTAQGLVQGIHHRRCRIIQRADGYGYSTFKTSSYS